MVCMDEVVKWKRVGPNLVKDMFWEIWSFFSYLVFYHDRTLGGGFVLQMRPFISIIGKENIVLMILVDTFHNV